MKWFRHETDAKDSEKLEEILDAFGFEGIGRFWRIVEMIADKMDHTDRCHVELPVAKWCSVLKFKRSKLIAFLLGLEKQMSFKVEPSENQTIETAKQLRISWPKLLEKKDDYSKYLEVTRNKNLSKKQIQKQKEDKDKTKPKHVVHADDYSQRFELVWKQYPEPKGKKLAFRHFQASVGTDEDFAQLQTALANYRAQIEAERESGWHRRWQNGSTWFNNWRDWIDHKIATTQALSPPQKPSRQERARDSVNGFAGRMKALQAGGATSGQP